MANTFNICNNLQAIADAIENGGGGGGGTTVIANPSGTPTDTLNTIQIASTIYDIIGGGGGGSTSADNVTYDNTTSGLTATNVQDAIDENADNISNKAEVKSVTISAQTTNANGMAILTNVPTTAKFVSVDLYAVCTPFWNNDLQKWCIICRGLNVNGSPLANTALPAFMAYYIE